MHMYVHTSAHRQLVSKDGRREQWRLVPRRRLELEVAVIDESGQRAHEFAQEHDQSRRPTWYVAIRP